MNPETRISVFERGGYNCEICGKPVNHEGTPQIAHCIHKGKQAENHIMPYIWNKYKKDRGRKFIQVNILENKMNLVAVCSLRCNDKCNIFFKPVERDNLIDYIIKETGCLEA